MASPQDILRYLADLAPEGGKVVDVVHRSSEFSYLGWRPSLVEPLITDGSSTLREVVHRDLNRLAAIDALHSAERLLRIGWLFVAGKITHRGKPTQFCVPLLSVPIRLQRLGRGHRIIHEGDVEMPADLFDDEARSLLEDSRDPYLATGETEASAIALASARAMLADWTPVTSAETLFDNIADGDDSNDYFVVSVRAPDVYAIGHVEGAINIGWKAVADPANMAMLPTDQPIMVYCYTGHTGQAAATALKLFGYDVINMKFGMMGWSDDPDVVGTTPFTTAPDYPTVTG